MTVQPLPYIDLSPQIIQVLTKPQTEAGVKVQVFWVFLVGQIPKMLLKIVPQLRFGRSLARQRFGGS